MTISTTTIKNSYSGDGSVVAFTYTFKIADAAFIEVIVKPILLELKALELLELLLLIMQ